MAEKQILAALELTDQSVRLLVGEYFNTRVNVLCAKEVPLQGIEGVAIKNPTAVSAAVQQAVKEAEEMLGHKIERVLLAIPAYRVMKNSIRVSKGIDNYERKVAVEDLQAAARKGYTYPVPEDKALINWMPLKYYTNRIAFKRMPVGEPCDVLEVEMDLFSADKYTAYDYARVVNRAGCQITDISLDIFAAAKEAALFELSVNKNILAADVEHDRTTLAILHNGQLNATKILDTGFADWEGALRNAYPVNEETAHKLVFQNADLGNRMPDDTPVHLWKKDGKVYQITVKQLNEALRPAVEQWCAKLAHAADAMLRLENLSITLMGRGAELDGLAETLTSCVHVPASSYYPDTIGVRKSRWTCCLGLIYTFIDAYPLYRNKKMSVSIPMKSEKKSSEKSAEDLSSRWKTLFQSDHQ